MLKIPRQFYNRPTKDVAIDLLGKYLVHKTSQIERIGKIVEVEAYLGQHDLAAHSSKGITNRTKIMFGPPGHAYIYLIYGIYHCFNIVTEEAGNGAAVLIRALEPIKNLESRTQGPGLLCKAMDINRDFNGYDLTGNELYLFEDPNAPAISIIKKPRIGVPYAKQWTNRLLRFYIKDSLFVSKI